MKKTWAFTWHLLAYAALVFALPFLVLYYQSLGFTGTQIGLLVGVTPLITLVGAPLGTAIADATRRHRLTMTLGLFVGSATIFALPLASTFTPIALLIVLNTIFLAPASSLATSATMFMLGDEKESYGRIRLGGTIGYGAAAAAAGILVQNYGLKFAFWGSATLCFLTLLVSQKLAYGQPEAKPAVGSGVRTLLGEPRWLLFLSVAFAAGLANVPTGSYFFPYLAALGANEALMGIALTIGMISEIPVFLYGDRLVRRFNSYGLLMLALAFTGARLLAFSACGTPALALLLQLSSGLAFPAMWMGGVFYAEENAPAGMSATAQGLFGAMIGGLGTAVGGFSGGLLLDSLGVRGMYLAFGLVVLAIAATAALVERRLRARELALSGTL